MTAASPLVFDGDYPMAFPALEINCDLTRPLAEVRGRARHPHDADDPAGVLATLPEMRRGGVATALVKVAARHENAGSIMWSYSGAEAAVGVALGQLAYYRALEARGEVRVLTSAPQLLSHLSAWRDAADRSALPIGLLIGMEGADPILDPSEVPTWWDRGLRVVSLAHYGASRYAHGTGTGVAGTLLDAGRDLLRALDEVGMILDVSHVSDAANRESLDVFSGAVIASHSTCRAIVPGERQLPDDIIRQVVGRGGVIGISFDAWMLNHRREYDWTLRSDIAGRRAKDDGPITLEDVADHVVHVCELAGSTRHVGIGGDTDGQGGRDGAPDEIDSVADYARLGDVLARRGFDEAGIEAVLSANWRDFYAASLPN